MAARRSFAELLAAASGGDETSVSDLVAGYMPALRVAVRRLLNRSSLRRQYDSLDICLSAWGSVLAGHARQELNLHDPEHLKALLHKVVFRKWVEAVRRAAAQRRGALRPMAGDSALAECVADQPTPSAELAQRDLIEWVLTRLSDDERRLVLLRMGGKKWEEIGRMTNQSADNARVTVTRRLSQLRDELGDSRDSLVLGSMADRMEQG